MINTVQTWAVNLVSAIKAAAVAVWDGLASLTHRILDWFKSLPSRLWSSMTGSAPPATEGPAKAGGTMGMGPPTSPGPPPVAANSNAPGSSAANPVYNFQLNQPSARDLAYGVTANQARSLGAGPRASTGFDANMHPSFSTSGGH
jgi:hypothetical protein